MDKMWKEIFEMYVKCDKAIDTLYSNHILDEESCNNLKVQLLEDIIVTMKSEIEE